MHSDFRDNLIRITLLDQADMFKIDEELVFGTLQVKGFENITIEKIKEQINHLAKEKFLEETDEDKYIISEAGREELEEVKKILENLI